MKKYIEEAIIIETIEKEPHFSADSVNYKIIQERKSLLESLFEPFFSNSIFDLFGVSTSFNDDFDEEDDSIYFQKPAEPETAIIVETKEAYIREITYAYYEFED